MLFNVRNGTLDLATCQLRPHDPADYLTKLSPVTYDPDATAPTWDRFIGRIFQTADGHERPELSEYVQRACGYSITGDVGGQCLMILHGNGRNGKTTFLNVLKHVWGDGEYGITARPELLVKTREKTNSEDEAILFGVRLAVCSETNDGQRFDESTVKRLCGGGKIRARRLYENSFEFEATHKLWMDCNHLPRIGGTDLGIWRRIKLLPFQATIAEGETDPNLEAKLTAETPGILNWILAGLRNWKANGLKEPPQVLQANEEYRSENDTIQQFLNDCTREEPEGRVVPAALYGAYRKWCEDNGHQYPLSLPQLAVKLKSKKYENRKSNGIRSWRGFSLTAYVGLSWGSREDEESRWS